MRRQGKRAKCAVAVFLGLSLLAVILAGTSLAEVDQKGNLIGSFHGGISPSKLPRTESAPVAVQMGGKIKTVDKSIPPKLTQIDLEINSHGKIDTKGLAKCPLGRLNKISTAGAKKVCGEALVGHGNVTSRVSLPGQGVFASNGQLLAFNGTYKGRQAVFGHVESGPPLPLTYVIVFELTKAKGTFGTRLIGALPEIASEYGYISSFDISLGRRYRYQGEKRSFVSASCPAPSGFTAAVFPLARASYVFENGTVLSSLLERTCKVRR